MPTVPAREFHGRDDELALIRGELERLADGAEAVVVVEGAARHGQEPSARRGGDDRARPRHSSRPQRCRSERDHGRARRTSSGLVRRNEPLLDPDGLSTLRAEPGNASGCFATCSGCWSVPRSRPRSSSHRRRSVGGQRHDRGTSRRCRARLARLADRVGARLGPPPETAPLRPCPRSARAERRAQSPSAPRRWCRCPPGRRHPRGEPDHILQLFAQAAGSPFLLVEMLLGLREEDRIRVVGRPGAR